ncbi:hypothetical protein [uncultured Neptuniibacter sp.]|uniref:hypothetical protein n=1 Tax=uncultured Neptuniibacter sp. TaxID=502143 RepID=UPI002638C3B4|nr:hypothetical protein [uncultured Neptuniibacter sp.]
MYRSILISSLVFLSCSSIAAEQLIEGPAEVAQLREISNQLNNVSDLVMTCMDQGSSHRECLCENGDEIESFNLAVKAMNRSGSRWQGLDLVRYRSDEGVWVTLSLAGLRRQAGQPLNCP